jgi:dienelactone hydrolase
MLYWNGNLSNIMAEATRTWRLEGFAPARRLRAKVRGRRLGPPIELVVYPGAYHGFYYPHLQPGMTMFDHWLEYNGEAADNATHHLHQFLDRHLD